MPHLPEPVREHREISLLGHRERDNHVVGGGGGSHLSDFSSLQTLWSLYRDYDYGFVKLKAINHSSLLFEYKKSSNGEVYDSFTISRDYRDVLACVHDGCEPTTLAS
ncbi:nucleotide pyrophosphatase/phosphodiesterase-like [Diospyros lotus]|uniref:nucleotide pyrophosphatase/phosphodiesterase-like n=1 Tax=Diospyros lotus TaxID=55363 RepID=UPI00225A8F00|nr:nucleotide pyrophosphatase/phosphodiesterase-like [Diospyros lotus]